MPADGVRALFPPAPEPASLMFLCLSFGSAEPTAEQLNEWFL